MFEIHGEGQQLRTERAVLLMEALDKVIPELGAD